MHVAVIGLNHKIAPIEVREKVAFTAEELPQALQELKELADEGVILSTCNRTEVYFTAEDEESAEKQIRHLLENRARARCKMQDARCQNLSLYKHTDEACARHLFHVASGLDSMMLGEHQILGQVRDAHAKAHQCGTLGAVLDELLRRAIAVGKRARTETGISKGAVSIGSAAVELARSIYGDLRGCTVMLIGAGKMGESTARYLSGVGVKKLYVANRTRSRADELALALGGESVPYEELWTWLPHADIVISSTGSPHFIISSESLRGVMRVRRHRPLFLIDIAVPRDIDPEANKLDGVFLYDIDDLQGVVEENIKERQQEVAQVEAIIEEQVQGFLSWLAAQEAKPTIVQLLNKAEGVRQESLNELFKQMPNLSERERQTIEAWAKAFTMRLLKDPLGALNELPASRNGVDKLKLVRELFGLEEEWGEDK